MIKRKPDWLKSHKLGAKKSGEIRRRLNKYKLHTVCESARCPNQGECFERGTATFMILGEICTRNCTFCAVKKDAAKLAHLDPDEPKNIALMAKELGLRHIVITTVTRDDLGDGGAAQFAEVITEIRNICDHKPTIEVLISDLEGKRKSLELILAARPDVINHNVETINRLYPQVRPMADYDRSLQVLRICGEAGFITKSGFMVGLGEESQEVLNLMQDLRDQDVDILTIGQYMAPSSNHFPVADYIHPQTFLYYKEQAMEMGFKLVESAPLVRSSYHAEKAKEIIDFQGNLK